MNNPALGGLVFATVSTAAAGPLVRLWLHRRQNFDHPNERSSHTVPTPRGGGLACAVGGAVGAAASRLLGSSPTTSWVGASAVLAMVGRTDDVVGMAPSPRLGAQVLVGVVAGAQTAGPPGAMAGAVAVPCIVNAFNFMDGISGISGGTAAAWGSVVASDRALSQSGRTQGAIAAGMGLGFLPYNVPRASMFLGDVGSYLLGSGIAVTVLECAFTNRRPDLPSAGRAAAPLAPYLADTACTIVRRAIRGESVTDAHREHAYQRLVHETDWPHWAVSGLVSAAATSCGLAARRRHGVMAVASIVILYLASPSVAQFARSSLGESAVSVSGGRS